MWGLTDLLDIYTDYVDVFPMHVGINRANIRFLFSGPSVPHARGD